MSRSEESRAIVERIVVEGDLVLLTPTSLGNGDDDGLTDVPLMLDELEGKAALTGTSIAGALRNYLREREKGYGIEEDRGSASLKLFGFVEGKEGDQSCLIVDDSIGRKPETELRDGVKIESKTRTAFIDDKGKGSKFDIELLEAGTAFKLCFELLISDAKTKDKDGNEIPARDELLKAFATALQGFEKGEIYLGARKRRGYGECKVENWTVKYYSLKTKNGLLSWLGLDKTKLKDIKAEEINEFQGTAIKETLKTAFNLTNEIQTDEDKRAYFELDAWFALDGSMLIRSGSKLGVSDKAQPDSVHLRSKRGNDTKPIVSGTSLAGVLRHRAVRIVNTLKPDNDGKFVEEIFGADMKELEERNKKKGTKKQPFASRLEVRETVIKNTNDLVQTRVKIDRFTGGAFEGALFDAAPVFSNGEKQAINLKLRLRTGRLKKDDGTLEADEENKSRTEAEIGLLLLLLKDLWTSDLAIGGESSIGRGRLKGKTACLNYKNGTGSWHANLEQQSDGTIKISGQRNKDELNKLVEQFNRKLNPTNTTDKNEDANDKQN